MKHKVLILGSILILLISACAPQAAATASPVDVQHTAEAAAFTMVAQNSAGNSHQHADSANRSGQFNSSTDIDPHSPANYRSLARNCHKSPWHSDTGHLATSFDK